MSQQQDCIFCQIVSGQIPAERLYEDDDILVFRDIQPQAPFHCLLIPKLHIATLDDLVPEQAQLAGRLLLTAKRLAAEHGLPGYRVAVNTNREGGQAVYHVHMHMLGGRQMKPELG